MTEDAKLCLARSQNDLLDRGQHRRWILTSWLTRRVPQYSQRKRQLQTSKCKTVLCDCIRLPGHIGRTSARRKREESTTTTRPLLAETRASRAVR